jgi:trehalose synthase
MIEVDVRATPLERLAALLPPERGDRLRRSAEDARRAFGDRTVWHVNATATGGGVAEMLQTLLAYGQGAGIANRWLVLDADPEFFAVTKRLHNMLHGDPGDGGALGADEHSHYRGTLAHNLRDLVSRVAPGDIVLLHDPQTAGLVEGLLAAGAHVVWRCHVGRDTSTELTEAAWAFLRPYVEPAEAHIFSRRAYAPAWAQRRLVVIPPSIDPFSAKNADLSEQEVRCVRAAAGLVSGLAAGEPVPFKRRDGSRGTVRDHAAGGGLVLDGPPPPHDVPLVVQVSRWDRLKDMGGVMAGFADLVAADGLGDAHLMLVGPPASDVADDPEGAAVLAACRDRWRALPDAVRGRVHLTSIPLDDVDENATIVNAVQRHARVVVQKSLVEGFGLTVTEAMWKGRPVLASRVGGIQDQIVHGRDGLLLDDPEDLATFGRELAGLLADPARADRLGAAGRERVREEFLGDRHLQQYVRLFAAVVGAGGRDGAAATGGEPG